MNENKRLERLNYNVLEKYQRAKTGRTPKLLKKVVSEQEISELYKYLRTTPIPTTKGNKCITSKNKDLLLSLSSRLSYEEFAKVCTLNVYLSHKGNENEMITAYERVDTELADLVKYVQQSGWDNPVTIENQMLLERLLGEKPYTKLNKMFNTNFHTKEIKVAQRRKNVVYNPQFYIDELVNEPIRQSRKTGFLSRIEIWVDEDNLEDSI